MSKINRRLLSCKELAEPDHLSRSSIVPAAKIKLPKFMMTLAEFWSNKNKSKHKKSTDGICFRIYNSELIDSDNEVNNVETKESSHRYSDLEGSSQAWNLKISLDSDPVNVENSDQINSSPYASTTKSICDILSFETKVTEECIFELAIQEELNDSDCDSQQSNLINSPKNLGFKRTAQKDMNLLNTYNTISRIDAYRAKIRNTMTFIKSNEFDEETWESTPHKLKMTKIPQSASKYYSNTTNTSKRFIETGLNKSYWNYREESRNSYKFSFPLKTRKSLASQSNSIKKKLVKALSFNQHQSSIKEMDAEIFCKINQLSKLENCLKEQEQINDSLRMQIFNIVTTKMFQ